MPDWPDGVAAGTRREALPYELCVCGGYCSTGLSADGLDGVSACNSEGTVADSHETTTQAAHKNRSKHGKKHNCSAPRLLRPCERCSIAHTL